MLLSSEATASIAGCDPSKVAAGLVLDPGSDVWLLPGEGVLRLSSAGLAFFPGPVAERCVRALASGPQPAEVLFQALGQGLPAAQRMAGLDSLRAGGLLRSTDADPRCTLPTAAEVAEIASEAGLSAGFFPADGLGPEPSAPHVSVTLDPQRMVVGPILRGEGRDPCAACLAQRLAENDDLSPLIAARAGSIRRVQQARVPAEEAAALRAFLRGALAALAVLPPGTILLRHAADGTWQRARALPRGGCPDCGAPALCRSEPGPAPLRDGGYRPLAAGALLARLATVVDPVTGIVRDLVAPSGPAGPGGHGHVVIARHAFPLARPDPEAVLRNRSGRSAGKGMTSDEARAGAIAEALERYAGIARPTDPVVVARASALDAEVLHPAGLTLYSDAQLAAAAEWRALGSPAAWVPDPFGRDAPMAWTPVRELGSGVAGWAPAALSWHQMPDLQGCAVPGRADSNGCAAGQAQTDARLQALLELVERDAVAIWWWNRLPRPRIDPERLEDPWCAAALRRVGRAGWRTGLFDLTHDLGVPVVAAVGWPGQGTGPLLLGFGAHPSPAVAAARAVTEVLQALPEGSPDRIGGDPRQGFGLLPGCRLHDRGVTDDLGFLIPPEAAALQDPPMVARVPATATEALDDLAGRLAGLGLRIWELDQSRPDVPLPVVRLFVPGLRHFRPRFAPGRLDGVPGLPGAAAATVRNRLFIRQ